jgi:hypothetical protein
MFTFFGASDSKYTKRNPVKKYQKEYMHSSCREKGILWDTGIQKCFIIGQNITKHKLPRYKKE